MLPHLGAGASVGIEVSPLFSLFTSGYTILILLLTGCLHPRIPAYTSFDAARSFNTLHQQPHECL